MNPNDRVMYRTSELPGTRVTALIESRVQEWRTYELAKSERTWRVRGVVSSQLTLFGNLADVLASVSPPMVRLPPSMKTLFIHHGGKNVLFFDLRSNEDRRWTGAEVLVKTALPADALLFATEPLNRLVDFLSLRQPQPIVLHHLELLSPVDQQVIGYDVLLPYARGLELGDFAGTYQPMEFTPIDSILREAVCSSSVYYRLLCSYRAHESLKWLRRSLRESAEALSIAERLPKEVRVDPKRLIDHGLSEHKAAGVTGLSKLIELYNDHRNAIAHFLVDQGDQRAHCPIGDGEYQRDWGFAAAILLHYLKAERESLWSYYQRHIMPVSMHGSILPLSENRDVFCVTEPKRLTE